MNLLELLSVKLNERFIIQGKSKIICEFYKEHNSDELFLRTEYNGYKKEKDTLTHDMLNKILNGEFKIIIEKVANEKQKEILRALKLLGFNYIYCNSNNCILTTNIPLIKLKEYWDIETEYDYISNTTVEKMNLLSSLVSWEDEVPVKIDDLLK